MHAHSCCLSLQIMRDPETGNSRGFGFISYDSFDASDAAIEVCNFYVYFPLSKLYSLPAENPSELLRWLFPGTN